MQFDKTIGGSGYEFEATVSNTADSGLIIAGNSASNISGDKTENSRGDYDIWVVKLNKNGKISWDKTLGGYGNDNVRSIQETKEIFSLLVAPLLPESVARNQKRQEAGLISGL